MLGVPRAHLRRKRCALGTGLALYVTEVTKPGGLRGLI